MTKCVKCVYVKCAIVMVWRKLFNFFLLETNFIGFLDPKSVHFDTKFIIIAITEGKIWALGYFRRIGGHFWKNMFISDTKCDLNCVL